MARNTDPTRIEKIHKATMHMVVQNGYGGASVSSIARRAGVAEGYLYRFYKGKSELVNGLFYKVLSEVANHMEEVLERSKSIGEVLDELLHQMLKLTHSTPEKIMFLYKLMHDPTFRMEESLRDRIFDICSRFKKLGAETGQMDPLISEENIYLLCVAYPISFINVRLKGLFYTQKLDEEGLNNVKLLILKSLKK
ncbi:MAG: TetR/AcrR family transcriptional regulator, repressor of fatR-cypB operon [Bacteroidales bacterium]|jgi:AcrR family transcriptional regulator|nr:TetR/AcrR family transcriptional regulator, repressor of fatR-cypB operon [Bacteroidales bacterium]MDN5329139.1 TetR/AcrR family transcriptional regulator, repressor of fatR-cypB operon [Bacteroidales bacterium]